MHTAYNSKCRLLTYWGVSWGSARWPMILTGVSHMSGSYCLSANLGWLWLELLGQCGSASWVSHPPVDCRMYRKGRTLKEQVETHKPLTVTVTLSLPPHSVGSVKSYGQAPSQSEWHCEVKWQWARIRKGRKKKAFSQPSTGTIIIPGLHFLCVFFFSETFHSVCLQLSIFGCPKHHL